LSRVEGAKGEDITMNLSAPTNLFFFISLVIAIFGLLAGMGVIGGMPLASYIIVAIGYAVLAAGCLFKGV
jgi:hypothetical protein